MSNYQKYVNAFCESLNVTADCLEGLRYQDVDEWDSVGHMSLVAEIEDAFDIMMETDDIIEFSSFEKGKEILAK